MLKISSLVALLLKATAKQRATECPGRESKHRMGGRIDLVLRMFLQIVK